MHLIVDLNKKSRVTFNNRFYNLFLQNPSIKDIYSPIHECDSENFGRNQYASLITKWFSCSKYKILTDILKIPKNFVK